MDILVVHIGGGDTVYGNADDPIRFAVSKLAHLHFTTTKEYAENLSKIGEEKFRIFWVGNPGLDNIRNIPHLTLDKLSRFLEFEIKNNGYIVLIQHPLSSEMKNSYLQMKVTLESIEEFCGETHTKALGIYPNTDPGSTDILKAISELRNCGSIKFYKTLPREIFVNVMRNALALAGNSSMGILEAPFYGFPVVNVGNRQKGRLNSGNAEFVIHDKEEIKKALYKACFDENYRTHIKNLKNPYGDGNASQKIKDILSSIDTNERKWHIKEKLC